MNVQLYLGAAPARTMYAYAARASARAPAV